MTSTNFTVGLGADRSSSRVLKPPGGGHSDIFGVRGNGDESKAAGRRSHVSSSSISEIIRVETATVSSSTTTVQKTEDTVETNGSVEQNGNSPEPLVAKPQRVRVPPGGYSTALW